MQKWNTLKSGKDISGVSKDNWQIIQYDDGINQLEHGRYFPWVLKTQKDCESRSGNLTYVHISEGISVAADFLTNKNSRSLSLWLWVHTSECLGTSYSFWSRLLSAYCSEVSAMHIEHQYNPKCSVCTQTPWNCSSQSFKPS